MRRDRLAKIAELVTTNSIRRQEELTDLLNSQGFSSTQATVSRDVRKLGIVKTLDETGNYRYMMPEARDERVAISKYHNIIKEATVSVDTAMNIVVIKCHTGMAMAVCSAIDAVESNHSVGTIAGDDTIFMACRSVEDASLLMSAIKSYL